MPDPVNSLELAQRLRRNAAETNIPEYAALMRRAAEDLEGFACVSSPVMPPLERRAG